MKRQQAGLGLAVLMSMCTLSLTSTFCLADDPDYGPQDAIEPPIITYPETGAHFLASSAITTSCTPGYDLDCNKVTGQPDVTDSVTHVWSGCSSDFPNGNIGTTVVYHCRDDQGGDWLQVICNDDWDDPYNAALCDEDAGVSTVVEFSALVPYVEQIDFSGTNNYAMMDDSDPPVEITDPEYVRSTARNEPACQQMGESVTFTEVTFTSDNGDLDEAESVKVWASGAVDGLDFPDTDDSWQNWPSSGITMTSSEDLDDCVHKAADFWEFWYYRVPTGTNDAVPMYYEGPHTTEHVVYVVLDEPQAPQATPWQKVLDEACDVGSPAALESTATYFMWLELYFCVGGSYDTEWGAHAYTTNGTTGYFKLKSWLNALPNVGTVNCYDMAKALVVYANAVGCHTSNTYVIPFGYLNCIRPIGKGWTNNPFYDNEQYDDDPIVNGDWDEDDGRSGFGNHAFARLSGDIYDASGGQVDVDGTPDAAPHTSRSLDGDDTWTDDYRDRVIDDDPASSPGTPTPYAFSVANE